MADKKDTFSIFFPEAHDPMDDAIEVIKASPDAPSDDDDTPCRQQDIDDYYYRLESDKT
jgi:hypothetical protein